MTEDGAAEGALATRLAWLTGLRLVLLTVLLALIASLYLRRGFESGSYSVDVVVGTLGVGYALAALYATVLRGRKHLRSLGYAQLLLDQVTWTALVYVSGGPTSGATALYGLTCLTGAILLGPRGAAAAAIAGAVLYSGVCIGFVTGLLPVPPDQLDASYPIEVSQIVYPFFLNLLVLMVVTLLGAYLAERLRLAGGHLQAATRRADEAERLAALGRLAAGLAHEIRNPLGSIVGSIQLLSSAEGLDDEARQLFGIVERETARLNDLVGDMLQLSGPKPPALTPVAVARTAREVVALASQSGRGGDVIVRYEGPNSDDGPVVQADSAQLRQVVWNLVRNAIQASNPGAEVCVRVREEQGTTLLEVRDDGPGISAEARARLFDAFFTTRSSGMGIGLAVVKRIVDDHGWTIDVESAERRGATFRIRMVGRGSFA